MFERYGEHMSRWLVQYSVIITAAVLMHTVLLPWHCRDLPFSYYYQPVEGGGARVGGGPEENVSGAGVAVTGLAVVVVTADRKPATLPATLDSVKLNNP